MKTWADIGFEIEITADQSPSLRLLQSVDVTKFKGESMHHSGGAWAETKLIYVNPMRDLLNTQKTDLGVVVVGLGLGYIEMSLARESLLQKVPPSGIRQMTSYESVPELREFFWSWLHEKELHPEVQDIYDQVAAFVISETTLTISNLKSFLKYHFKSLDSLAGALEVTTDLPTNVQAIFYDAFSSKTTPLLWEQHFLENFLQKTAGTSCLFSTYACRVSLKQALLASGFQYEVRPGFQGKRNSTIAWKGLKN